MWEVIWNSNWTGWAILMVVILFLAWRCGEDVKMHSSELENHTLAVIHCGGCGKPLTVPVPFKGINLCSGCRYGQLIMEEANKIGEKSCGEK